MLYPRYCTEKYLDQYMWYFLEAYIDSLGFSKMAKTYKDLFDQIIQFDHLYSSYISARKGKRRKLPCRTFEQDLEGNIISIQNDLIWGTYKTGGYKEFYVHEPKTRKVVALHLFRDRVVQHAIMKVIEPIWESRFISDSYACRISKGTHKGADKVQIMMRRCLKNHGKIFALKADIRRYFASISHEKLKNLLRQRISDDKALKLIDGIIDSYNEIDTPGKGLPIGNLTSQLFANIYLDHLDQWIKFNKREKWYARYMDDFILIHQDKRHLQSLRFDIERFLQDELDLRTNDKTAIFPVAHHQGRGLDFLGYHLWPHGRRLRKQSLKRFKRRVRTLQKHYAESRINISNIHEQLSSMIAHAKHGNAHRAIEKVLENSTFRRLA